MTETARETRSPLRQWRRQPRVIALRISLQALRDVSLRALVGAAASGDLASFSVAAPAASPPSVPVGTAKVSKLARLTRRGKAGRGGASEAAA